MSMRRSSLALTCLFLALAGTAPVSAQEGATPAEGTAGDASAEANPTAGGEAGAPAGPTEDASAAGEAAADAEKAAEAAAADPAAAAAAGEQAAEQAAGSAEAAAGEAAAAPAEAAAAGEAAAVDAAAAGQSAAQEAAAGAEAAAEETAADAEAAAEGTAAGAEAAAVAAMTAPPADDEVGVPFPSVYLGLSAGGHFVLTPWDFGEIDGEGRPVSPESAPIGKLRLGVQALEWLALEGSLGYFAFDASAETNPGWLYEVDALFFLKNAPWAGWVLAGAGLYHNAAPDLVEDEADFQVHVGLGTKIRLADWVWLRGEVRYYIGDTLDPDLPIASNLEATMGLDFMLWGPEPTPKDSDGDTILDTDDRCPTVPGQKSAAGCPDRDRDGIADAEDACPDAAGPPENKGCPDRDGDGVLDHEDACPDTPGVPEEKGCPVTVKDADGDGIPDDKDSCPDQPEDKDGVEDANGCPEEDADKDGILDADDKCPMRPETVNEFEDTDGCPDEKPAPKVVVTCERFELNESVYFDLGKSTIQARSFALLDKVAEALNENPHVKQIRVEGHTDNQGRDASNMTLSNARAKAVRAYLIGKGVAAARLVSKGYGETTPIATNDTEQGRAQNRRVDFVITKQDKREGCE